MKILLHTCCAPCSVFTLKSLKNDGHEIMGFFYRHNIHPFTECIKREDTMKEFAEAVNLKVIYQDNYELENFLQNTAFRESTRCTYCYHARLEATALLAKRGKFEAFTTTLLYSKFQNHDLIKSIGESLGKKIGVKFIYQNFSIGWKEGITESKEMGLYRQQYCGCIYSEKERYATKTKLKSPNLKSPT